MLKIVISTEVIEWLCNELDCGPEWAEEFAQNFISFLQASGGLTPAAPDQAKRPHLGFAPVYEGTLGYARKKQETPGR